jgi:hypothetical protein
MSVRVVPVKMRHPERATFRVITTSSPKTSVGTGWLQTVRAELKKVRNVWDSIGRDRKDIRKYLQAVFDLEKRWENQNTRDRNSEWILKNHKAPNPPSEEEPFGAIIYALLIFP